MRIAKLSFIKKIWENSKASPVNLRRRLMVFLLILMFAIMAGGVLLLGLLGVLPFGAGNTPMLVQNELDSLSAEISAQYGGALVQAVRMSERLSANISAFMRRDGLAAADLKRRPELLEPLLAELFPVLLNNLDVTDCSGVFAALDATVNPAAAGADRSKSGLYIRAIEPNIGRTGTEMRYLLRGPSAMAGDGRLNLQAKWDLEFNIADQPFWTEPIGAYETNPAAQLSRLVYWCSVSPVQGLNEAVMACSVPLVDEGGGIIGVCGFEISQMNFMLRHDPEISGFHRAVFLFSSANDGKISLEDALFAGNTTVYDAFPKHGLISGAGGADSFSAYTLPGGGAFIGMGREIRLYPEDSPFGKQMYWAALIIPKEDFDGAKNAARIRFGIVLLALAAAGVAVCVVLSRRYVKPITDTLALAAEGGIPEKTNIKEIDELIKKIKEQRPKDSRLPDNLFEDFIGRVKTLTPAQMEVLKHHAEGLSLEETAKHMFIAVSTLKKHNNRIYEKLQVSSQDELRLYISLLKKCGMMGQIFAESGNGGNGS